MREPDQKKLSECFRRDGCAVPGCGRFVPRRPTADLVADERSGWEQPCYFVILHPDEQCPLGALLQGWTGVGNLENDRDRVCCAQKRARRKSLRPSIYRKFDACRCHQELRILSCPVKRRADCPALFLPPTARDWNRR